MCFRPAVAEGGLDCPFCGKMINSVMGSLPYECPWCEEDIKDAVLAFQAAKDAAPAAPGAPAAPDAAPAAPGAPVPPK